MFDIAYLNALRRAEMEAVLPLLPAGARVLEFGSGTGEQARFLAERGFDVDALDLESSNYAQHRVFPIQDYDGRHIPLSDRSVDVIFSSNVLEHVANYVEISAEFLRILKADGFAVHVLPTSAWRFWSFVTYAAESLKAAAELPAFLVRLPAMKNRRRAFAGQLRRIASGFVPRGHGTSAEGFSELWTFSRAAWRRKFERAGFEVVEDRPTDLFYTGCTLLGASLPIPKRRALGRLLGSATRMYVVRPRSIQLHLRATK
jgi:SAM-dependent methyltransferase